MSGLFFERQPHSRIAIASVVFAVVAVSLAAVAPLGYKQQWWDYPVALSYLMPVAAAVALVALLTALIGLGHAWFGGSRRGKTLVVVAVLLAVLVLMPSVDNMLRWLRFPAINDISTNLENPPKFSLRAAATEPPKASAEVDAVVTANQQRCAYPQIQPYFSERAAVVVFDASKVIAVDLGWKIVSAKSAIPASIDDPVLLSFEAVVESEWFGFIDDVIVTVTAESGKSRLDIRSASRKGRSDLGVNAERVSMFLAAVAAALE